MRAKILWSNCMCVVVITSKVEIEYDAVRKIRKRFNEYRPVHLNFVYSPNAIRWRFSTFNWTFLMFLISFTLASIAEFISPSQMYRTWLPSLMIFILLINDTLFFSISFRSISQCKKHRNLLSLLFLRRSMIWSFSKNYFDIRVDSVDSRLFLERDRENCSITTAIDSKWFFWSFGGKVDCISCQKIHCLNNTTRGNSKFFFLVFWDKNLFYH